MAIIPRFLFKIEQYALILEQKRKLSLRRTWDLDDIWLNKWSFGVLFGRSFFILLNYLEINVN